MAGQRENAPHLRRLRSKGSRRSAPRRRAGHSLGPHGPVKDHALLALETFENPSKKFKFQAKHFAFADEAQKAAFAADFKAATGKAFDGGNWELNTIAGEWDALAGLAVGRDPSAWRLQRLKFLNGLQQDNVAGALAAIHSQKIIDGLTRAATPAEFLNVIVDMSRVVNVGWRLNNPWFGFSYKLQYRPFHPDPAVGIGIEEIRKDTLTLKATLELLRDQKDIVLPAGVRYGRRSRVDRILAFGKTASDSGTTSESSWPVRHFSRRSS